VFDIIVRNGLLVDGVSDDPVNTDIGIVGDRVGEVGHIETDARLEIDASGLVVAPGFIDIHSHSDYTLLIDPRAVSAIHQGVTLEVVGNCGHGCFPLGDPVVAKKAIYGYSDTLPISWSSADEYFTLLESVNPALNIVSLVPHGQLRMAVAGFSDLPLTNAQLRLMKNALSRSLEEGAWGLSTGLEYATESGASENEIVALCAALRPRDDLYACHTRFRDQGAPEGVDEAIRTARTAGVRLQVSHLVPRSGDTDTAECISSVEKAHSAGLDVAFDMHTRLFGFTYLYSVLPPWVHAEGEGRLTELLRDDSARERMKEFRSILSAGGDWNRVVLLDSREYTEYGRRSIASIASERRQDPLDCVYDLLLGAQTPSSLMVLIDCHSENQQEFAFSHPLSMPASDATTLATEGPLRSNIFHGAYTWAAYFYRFAVKQRRFLSLAQAVKRLTSVPAERLGLIGRGSLVPGNYADLAIFDPEDFAERGTRFEPNQTARGMVHVLVNGVPVMLDGTLTGSRSGRVLRK